MSSNLVNAAGSKDKPKLELQVADCDFDPSSIYLHKQNMSQLRLMKGDTAFVLGKRGKNFLFVVLTNDSQIGKIKMNEISRLNLRVKIGDKVTIQSCQMLENLTRIHVLPFQSSAKQDNQSFTKSVIPFFKDAYRPVTVGQRFSFNYKNHDIQFKIIAAQKDNYGIVNPSTILYTEGDPIKQEQQEKHEHQHVYFDDIGGYRIQINPLVEQIKLTLFHPEVSRGFSLKKCSTILLSGPSGIGKTLLCKALSSELNAFHLWINCKDIASIKSKMNGDAQSFIRRAFQVAEQNTPAIIYIDDIDFLVYDATNELIFDNAEKRVINQLLTLIDQLKYKAKIVVIGVAKNKNNIDQEFLRYDRFDSFLHLGLPEVNDRHQILKIHTQKFNLDENVNLKQIAQSTDDFVGAELEQLCSNAALYNFQKNKHKINLMDKQTNKAIMKQTKICYDHFIQALNSMISRKAIQSNQSMLQNKELFKFDGIQQAQQIKIIRDQLQKCNSGALKIFDKLVNKSHVLDELANGFDAISKQEYKKDLFYLSSQYRLIKLNESNQNNRQNNLQLAQLKQKISYLEILYNSVRDELKENSIQSNMTSFKSTQDLKTLRVKESDKIRYQMLADLQEFFEDCTVYIKLCQVSINESVKTGNFQDSFNQIKRSLSKLRQKIAKKSQKHQQQLVNYKKIFDHQN